MVCGDIVGTFRRLGLWGYVIVGVFILVVAYFLIFHLEHLAAYSTAIFLILFLLFHIVMHRGHGHGGRRVGSHGGHEEEKVLVSEEHSHSEIEEKSS